MGSNNPGMIQTLYSDRAKTENMKKKTKSISHFNLAFNLKYPLNSAFHLDFVFGLTVKNEINKIQNRILKCTSSLL